MFLEAQHDIDPDLVWPVKVIENVGGRLLLRYATAETASGDFWLFYLHHRLHPIGWARSHDCKYQPPAGQFAYSCSVVANCSRLMVIVFRWHRLALTIDCARRSFCFSTPTIRNKLPSADILHIDNESVFKSRLKIFLFNHRFIPPN